MILNDINYPIKPDYSNLRTFVINLDDYRENYEKQLPYLQSIGLKPERFSGVNALKDEHLKPEYKEYISKFAFNFTPKSVIGCSLSHILCCKYIYDNYITCENNHQQYFLIIEDDAFPKYNKIEFYERLNKTISDITILDINWELIQLFIIGIIDTYDTYTSHILHGSTVAYLININGIKKIIKSKIYNHIDLFTYNSFSFKKYNSKKNLFYTYEEKSTTRSMNNNYSKFYISNIIQFLLHKYLKQYLVNKDFSYDKLFQFKLFKLPNFKKEYTINELIDILFGLFFIKKIIKHSISYIKIK